ncbi:hypothetical protein [Amycolatopsis lexingtonensis]|uniref:hypothetical protein n=1 Tax=Amycolatopsis lexingtonensis TaxID=218822 RepID=UPI001177E5D3|nr:hypothetical protein [Amycolatopsis lexingtonensis]
MVVGDLGAAVRENDCSGRGPAGGGESAAERGYAGRMIEFRITHDLRAETAKSWAHGGFRCRFDGISFDLTADVRLLV